MAYATKATVEGVLGRSLTASEVTALPALLASVDAYINNEAETTFGTPVEATRYYDVDPEEPSRILDVDAFVTKVGDTDKAFTVQYVDADENIVSTVDSSDYEARPRNENVKKYLQRRSGVWGRGCPTSVTNIAVKAFFGYDSVPADIAYAAAWLAAKQIGSTQSLSLKSESIEGYSRTFADATKKEDGTFITDTLSRYREVLL